MRKHDSLFWLLLLGMGTAQLLAAVQIALSNLRLQEIQQALESAGYLAVPNQTLFMSVSRPVAAFCGGIFLSLTLGSLVSCITAFVMKLQSAVGNKKTSYCMVVSVWVVLLIVLYRSPSSSLCFWYLLFVPLVMWLGRSIINCNRSTGVQFGIASFLHCIMIILLAALWFGQLDQSLFLRVRDNVLLSNPLGRVLNTFYYKNNLYAAYRIKSFNQKAINTCTVSQQTKGVPIEAVRNVFVKHDCLPIQNHAASDFEVILGRQQMHFTKNGSDILQTSYETFLRNPDRTFDRVSRFTDACALDRKMMYWSLFLTLPLLVYLCVFHSLAAVSRLILPAATASLVAAVLCFVLGLGFFISMKPSSQDMITEKNLKSILHSKTVQKQIAALKYIRKNNLEIAEFEAYPQILKTQNTAVLYWLIQTLGISRVPSTRDDLVRLAGNPLPISLRCQVIEALSRRGNASLLPYLQRIVQTSPHWYVQWHAYQAMRGLGWNQHTACP